MERIGWRQTLIRKFDTRPLYIPNNAFTNIAVENPSRMHNRLIYETIGIRYEDAGAMGAVVAEVEAMLRAHEGIDSDNFLMVNFNAFAPSSLDFFIYCYTRDHGLGPVPPGEAGRAAAHHRDHRPPRGRDRVPDLHRAPCRRGAGRGASPSGDGARKDEA